MPKQLKADHPWVIKKLGFSPFTRDLELWALDIYIQAETRRREIERHESLKSANFCHSCGEEACGGCDQARGAIAARRGEVWFPDPWLTVQK